MSETLLATPTAQADGSPKRQAIIEAATRLFMAQGYGPVSMDAIARAANVSKATLYAHFASKDRLFATIVGGRCTQVAFDNAPFPDDGVDMRQVLTGIGRRLLGFLLAPETQAILRMAIVESARFPELGTAFLDSGPKMFITRLAAWIAAEHDAGRLDAPDPVVAADQFGALLRPLMFLRAMLAVAPAPDEAEIMATVDAAVGTFLRAYGPRPR